MLPLVGPGVPLASFDHCSPASLSSPSRGVRIILEWYLPCARLRRHRLVAVFGERDGGPRCADACRAGPPAPLGLAPRLSKSKGYPFSSTDPKCCGHALWVAMSSCRRRECDLLIPTSSEEIPKMADVAQRLNDLAPVMPRHWRRVSNVRTTQGVHYAQEWSSVHARCAGPDLGSCC